VLGGELRDRGLELVLGGELLELVLGGELLELVLGGELLELGLGSELLELVLGGELLELGPDGDELCLGGELFQLHPQLASCHWLRHVGCVRHGYTCLRGNARPSRRGASNRATWLGHDGAEGRASIGRDGLCFEHVTTWNRWYWS